MKSTVKAISKPNQKKNPSILEALGISVRHKGFNTGIQIIAADKRIQRINDTRALKPANLKTPTLPAHPTLTVQDLHKAARQALFVDLDFILELRPDFLNAPSTANEDSFGVGGTALHYAVAGDNPSVVQYLLSRGAIPDASSDRGITPLHLCCKKGSSECAALLLDYGASMTRKDHYNISPLCILTKEPCADSVLKKKRSEILTRFRSSQNNPQRRASIGSSSQAILQLTDKVLYRQ